jgi:phosphosulfolactate synthase (CoM biosynthesis protein A)
MRHPININVIKCESEQDAQFQLSKHINDGINNNKCFYNGYDKEQQFYLFIEFGKENITEDITTVFIF